MLHKYQVEAEEKEEEPGKLELLRLSAPPQPVEEEHLV